MDERHTRRQEMGATLRTGDLGWNDVLRYAREAEPLEYEQMIAAGVYPILYPLPAAPRSTLDNPRRIAASLV